MKFLPPEDEIRAQLRELTTQTRQLRADLQGLITKRGAPSRTAFSHDHRYRLRPDPSTANDDTRSRSAEPAPPKPRPSKPPKSARKSSKRG